MKIFNVILSAALILGLTGCATISDMFENEKKVDLSEVPAPALAAAREAVKGIILTEAEMEEEDGRSIYELEGTAEGKTYEIEVIPEGRVLEVEQDGD